MSWLTFYQVSCSSDHCYSVMLSEYSSGCCLVSHQRTDVTTALHVTSSYEHILTRDAFWHTIYVEHRCKPYEESNCNIYCKQSHLVDIQDAQEHLLNQMPEFQPHYRTFLSAPYIY